MIGQAWPKPGMGVCQRTFSPDSTFHVTGAGSSETPLACGPRNCGQFTVEADQVVFNEQKSTPITAGTIREPKKRAGRGAVPGFMVPSHVKNRKRLLTNHSSSLSRMLRNSIFILSPG